MQESKKSLAPTDFKSQPEMFIFKNCATPEHAGTTRAGAGRPMMLLTLWLMGNVSPWMSYDVITRAGNGLMLVSGDSAGDT